MLRACQSEPLPSPRAPEKRADNVQDWLIGKLSSHTFGMAFSWFNDNLKKPGEADNWQPDKFPPLSPVTWKLIAKMDWNKITLEFHVVNLRALKDTMTCPLS